MKLSPFHMMWIHGVAAAFFIGLWAVAAKVGWVNSPAFVSHVSMVALIYAAFAGWQAAHAGHEAHDYDED